MRPAHMPQERVLEKIFSGTAHVDARRRKVPLPGVIK